MLRLMGGREFHTAAPRTGWLAKTSGPLAHHRRSTSDMGASHCENRECAGAERIGCKCHPVPATPALAERDRPPFCSEKSAKRAQSAGRIAALNFISNLPMPLGAGDFVHRV